MEDTDRMRVNKKTKSSLKTMASKTNRGGPEVPVWLTLFWLVGPYSFAMALTALRATPARLGFELTALVAMCCFQCTLAYVAPPLRSPAGCAAVLCAAFAAGAPAAALSVRGVRVMMTLESLMNGLCRGVALLAHDALRNRSFAQRLGFVVIFHDVTAARALCSSTKGGVERRTRAARIARSFALWMPASAGAVAALLTLLPPPAVETAATAAEGPLARWPGMLLCSTSSGCLHMALRSACGVVFFYGFLVLVDGAYNGTLLLAGIAADPAMDAPYRSTSFGEFWGRRWDSAMQSILFAAAYRPARALGAPRAVAVLATFVLSAAVHTAGVAAGGASTAQCASMFAFFVAQAGFVVLEAAAGAPAGRLMTMGCLLLSAPLFAAPLLSVCGL